MRPEQLIEAALFVSTDPVPLDRLSQIAGLPREEIPPIIEALKEAYEKRESALEIREVGAAYIMQAKELFYQPLLNLMKPAVPPEVMKTLSLIALKQPVTQAEIVRSRGDSAYHHIRGLISKGFLEAVPQGRTKLLTTTRKFADYFGFEDDLGEIKKRLAALLEGSP
jgi:segregation and condensation protein B